VKQNHKQTIVAGDSKTFRFAVVDLSLDKSGKTPANGGGLDLRMLFSRQGQKGYSTSPDLELTGSWADTEGGLADFLLDSATSADLLGLYHYQAFVTDVDSESECIAEGLLDVKPKIDDVP
jgi:hypothetical protein